ncbi:MAG: hypothetical protein QOI04_1220 [Verrucomicrobiota bacterium]
MHHRAERFYLKLALGVPIGIILLVLFSWGGCHVYQTWEEGHLLRRATVFLNGGDTKSAVLSARRALQMNPRSAGAARILGQVAEGTHDRVAVDWRRKVVELEPHSTPDRVALADCALQFGDIGTAEKTLASIDGSGKQSAAFHAAAAHLAKARKNPEEARKHWVEALRLAPDDESYQMQFALSCLEQPDTAARREGQDILEKLRSSPKQRSAATRALIMDGVTHHHDATGLRTLAKELQSYPEASFTDRILYLEILRQLQDPEYTAYLTNIEKDASAKPTDLAALFSWMSANGMNMVALDFAKSVSEKVLNTWPVPWAMAEAYGKTSDWSALEKATKTANWAPFDFVRHAYLARALRGKDKPALAEHEWAAAMKGASNQSESLLLLARAISEWGWKNESVELLWQLTKYPEAQFEALRTLYVHYAKVEDTQGLYRVLVRLAEIDPGDLKVQNNLAQISLLLNADTPRARQLAIDLYHKEPSNAAYVSTYAFSLFAKGDAKGAVKIMGALPEEQIQDPSLAAYYGMMLAAMGEKEKAHRYIELGKKAHLLPEEKVLLDKAEATLQ